MTSTDDAFRIAELLASGMKCGNVLMTLALESRGEADPALVRAMSGLALGLGQGLACGAMTAGCCVLGLHGGRGGETEADDARFPPMLDDFSGWFHGMATDRFGGSTCADIMKFDEALKAARCPALIAETWARLQETLLDHGFDPNGSSDTGETWS